MVTLRTAPSDPLVAILEARGQATELAPDLLSLVAPHWAVPGYDSVKSARPRSTSCQFVNKRTLSSKMISGDCRYNSRNVWPRSKPSPKGQWSVTSTPQRVVADKGKSTQSSPLAVCPKHDPEGRGGLGPGKNWITNE